jgi:hypothetical protein
VPISNVLEFAAARGDEGESWDLSGNPPPYVGGYAQTPNFICQSAQITTSFEVLREAPFGSTLPVSA